MYMYILHHKLNLWEMFYHVLDKYQFQYIIVIQRRMPYTNTKFSMYK